MVIPFYYIKETKSFASTLGNIGKAVSGSTASKITTALGLAGAGVGLATGLVGLKRSMSDKVIFSVVYLNSNGLPKSSTIKAATPVEAISKLKSNNPKATRIKAFRLPDQDDQSQEYYNSLSR